MGILNITPDSFSDGDIYYSKPTKAIQAAIKMVKMGADIIDIGAESTRPGARLIKPEIEIKRLIRLPSIDYWPRIQHQKGTPKFSWPP